MAAVTGELRYFGEFPATEAAIRKLVAKLAAKCRHLTFCYEAGPTGYGLYRLLKSLGHECLVVAPSLVPKKASDRVKTNRRCGKPRQAVARGRAHRSVGAGRAP
jgi:transposase